MTPARRLRPLPWPSLLLAASLAAGAENPPSIAPGGNLIVDGVPPVPAEIADKASRYGEARGAVFADWRPGGNEILILTRFGDTNQVHLVETPGGARTQSRARTATRTSTRCWTGPARSPAWTRAASW